MGGTPITGLVSVEGPRAVRFDALDADLPTMGVAVDGGALARTANAAWTGTRSAHPAAQIASVAPTPVASSEASAVAAPAIVRTVQKIYRFLTAIVPPQ